VAVNVAQRRARTWLIELVYQRMTSRLPTGPTGADWRAATQIVDELLGDPESYLAAAGLPLAVRQAIMAQLAEPN